MKTILSHSIKLALSLVLFVNTVFAQSPHSLTDPAAVTIVQHTPGGEDRGITIVGNTIMKFRIANNGTTPGIQGTIPAGGLVIQIDFNAYYTFIGGNVLTSSPGFAVTNEDAVNHTLHITNTTAIEPGSALVGHENDGVRDFYINVKPTSNTTNPNGASVIMNVTVDDPTKVANVDGNDNASSFFVVAAGASLPVRSVQLGSTSNASTVNLKWVTESEYNTEKFIIERSVDGRIFSVIGESKAAGNTVASTSYTSADDIRAIATKPVLFYRIKVVDTDGKYTYSNTIAIRLTKQAKAQVWPSPFSSQLNVQVEQEAGATLEVKIYNMTGVMVYNKRQVTIAGTNTIQLVDQVSKLSGGMYIIELVSNNNKIYSETIVKQ
jgi:hypothetical protein